MSGIVKKVAIVGAGLGGLATAIALRNQGIEVQVYEKAKEFRPIGSGLGLMTNGFNSLEAIDPDLVQKIQTSSCCIGQFTLKNTRGETIRSNRKENSSSKGQENLSVTIWWWNLQQILAAKLPREIIHLDRRCVDLEQNKDGVEISFENGQTEYVDLLIGADGIKSTVRQKLIANDLPRYLGSLCWRAVVKCEQNFIAPDELIFIKGNNQFMFVLNLGDEHISWITRKLSPEYQLSRSAAERKSRVLDEIADWAEPIKEIVKATDADRILEGPIFDRPPLKTWSKGRVTLLGDAAHPMGPAMGQGANTAFEDARVLAHCLTHSATIEEAFTNYEKERIERTTIIQARSAEGEKRYYQTNNSQQRNTDIDFNDWLYNYKPFAGAIAV